MTLQEKKDYVMSRIGQDLCKSASDDFFEHTYMAMEKYGFSFHWSESWAWLNTLIGYDIGADKALKLIRYFERNGIDVLKLDAGDMDELVAACILGIGYYIDLKAWPKETPGTVRYTWPAHISQMLVDVKFDREDDADKYCICLDGYTMTFGGRTVSFCFDDYYGNIDHNDRSVVHFVQSHLDVESIFEAADIKSDDVRKLEKIDDFEIYTGEDDGPEISPVKIMSLVFIFADGSVCNCSDYPAVKNYRFQD